MSTPTQDLFNQAKQLLRIGTRSPSTEFRPGQWDAIRDWIWSLQIALSREILGKFALFRLDPSCQRIHVVDTTEIDIQQQEVKI